MRYWPLLVPALLVAVAFAGAAAPKPTLGRTWHVAPQALPGIEPTAQFRTIGEAAVRVAPGDTVLIHGGTYREYVLVEKSGTAAQPIRFVAAPSEPAATGVKSDDDPLRGLGL